MTYVIIEWTDSDPESADPDPDTDTDPADWISVVPDGTSFPAVHFPAVTRVAVTVTLYSINWEFCLRQPRRNQTRSPEAAFTKFPFTTKLFKSTTKSFLKCLPPYFYLLNLI